MGVIDFGVKLARLYLGANFKQLHLRAEDHYKQYKGKKIPLNIWLVLTYMCNLECVHCGAEINNSKAHLELEPERCLTVIDEIAAAGCSKIAISGGEPLLRKDIDAILQRCYDNNLITSLASNGWFVNQHIESLKKLGLLLISLDGTKTVHDKIRRRVGSYDKVMEAVKVAKENNIPVTLVTTIMAANVDNIKELAAIISELKVHWSANFLNDEGKVNTWQKEEKQKRVSAEKIREVLIEFSMCKNLRTSKPYLNFIQGKHKPPKCWAGIGYATVSPDGKLYPCIIAELDSDYDGIPLADNNFGEAFQQMPMYRKKCETCDIVCHMETNFLYDLHLNSIKQAFKYIVPLK